MTHYKQWGHDTATADAYVGPDREITIDTDRRELRLHNGTTPGGVRILNESQFGAYASLAFTGVVSTGLTANLAMSAAAVRKLHNVSAIGGPWTLTLPDLAELDIGASILIRATTADVKLAPVAGQGWVNQALDETDFLYSLPINKTITLAKMSLTRYFVTNLF